MNFTRTVPRSGQILLENLSHDEYWAFVSLMTGCANKKADQLSERAVAMARNILTSLCETVKE